MMITTRFATESDTPTILELIHLKADFDGVPNSVQATNQSLREGLFSDHPQAQVILAELDGHVIGMASFHSHYSTFITKPGIWLDDLFVRETYRGAGAGEALMIHLAKICLSRGGGRIEWSTAARNELGIKFYERIGSVVLQGSRLTRLSEDALNRLVALPAVERRASKRIQ
ncbi:MAG TPA: GNAT family N-acetyltransferase [Planctomycetaceae bacterium]|jgi:GNAT superfamily N-acetyltransferase|nr:GNAT family N-acetyltransferase [Planctomycetaceae bacterium]